MRKGLPICCLLLALLLCACRGSVSSEAQTTPAPMEEQIAESTPQPTAVSTLPPTPTPSPTPTPTQTPTPSPTPVPTPFGILWMPDTQLLSYYYPKKLEELGHEIAARRESENLIAVVHTGDIVDNGFKEEQWDRFDACLSAFSDDLPFYPVAGNHDLGVSRLQYDAYLKRPFLTKLPAEQTYEGGKMYYIVIDRDSVQILLLFVSWDCGQTDAERAWLDGVFDRYPDMPCILITHAYLKDDGSLHSRAKHLDAYVVAPHGNVKLVLCGHRRDAVTAIREYDMDGDGVPDRSVPVLMLNRQEGEYQYRVLVFDPVSRAIGIRTFTLGTEELIEADEKALLSFTLPDMF